MEGPGASVLESQRYRAHAGFVRVLAEFAIRRPILIAIEDVHWADEASLELIPYIARHLRTSSVLFVVTYRSDELHRNHPLTHVLEELSRARLADEIRVDPLTREDIGLLTRDLLGANSADQPLRDLVYEHSEGNPFFAEELLDAFLERGDLADVGGVWTLASDMSELPVPSSIQGIVQERFRRLAANEQQVLQTAAVIGRYFSFEVLQSVVGLPEAEIVAALRSAKDADLVAEARETKSDDVWAFRHSLTREAVLSELLRRERRLLHGAIAAVLEARASTSPADYAEELAYHFDAGGEQDAAFRYHQLAASESIRVFAFERAEVHLERALELARDDDPAIGTLHLRLMDVARWVEDSRRAVRAAERARLAFSAAGDVKSLGLALVRLSVGLLGIGERARAGDALREAVELLRPLGPSPVLARAYATLSQEASLARDWKSAIDWGERATAVARECGALSVELHAQIAMGTVRATQGDTAGLDLLRDCIARARAAFESTADPDFIGLGRRAYHNLVIELMAGGGDWHSVHDDAVAYCRRFGMRLDADIMRECAVAFSDGRWDEALRLEADIPPGTRWATGCQVMRAFIETARDGPPKVLRPPTMPISERRLAIDEAPKEGLEGLAAFVAGRHEEALAHADAVVRMQDPYAWGQWSVPPLAIIALESALLVGDEEAASRWFAFAASEQPGMGKDHRSAIRAYADGVLAIQTDKADAARRFAESAELLDELPGCAPAATAARLRRADLLRSTDLPEAQAEFQRAVAYWLKAGARWYLDQLAVWGKNRGITVPLAKAKSRTRSGLPTRLTPREREVAVLVADGLTNREIGQRLSIAERSAEGHLERIRNKLGMRSRAEIAAWIGADGSRR